MAKTIIQVPIKDGQVDIPMFLDAKREAVMIANDQEEVKRLFAIDAEKRAFADAMVAAAKARDDSSITPAIAAEATERVYDQFFVFKEPPTSGLVDLYINRVRRVYLPSILLTVIAGLGLGVVSTINYTKYKIQEANLTRQERAVESSIRSLFQQRTTLENQLSEISHYVAERKPVDAAEIREIVAVSGRQLGKTDEFFARFKPKGKPIEEEVTRENFSLAERETATIEDVLNQVSRDVGKANQLVVFNNNLASVRQNLDSLAAEVRSASPVPIFLERANSSYQAGIASIQRRQLSEAQGYQQQLSQIKGEAQQFAGLPPELEKAYHSVMNVVEHVPTKQWAEKTYVDGKSYAQQADVPHLKDAVEQLKKMDAQLRQEYDIFVVRLPDVRTAWPLEWYETGRNGSRRITNKDYFVRCQAKKDGVVVPISFYDVAQQKNVTVDMFGFRISDDSLHVGDEAMLEEFKQFVGSGRNAKVPLAKKKKGFPDEEVLYKSSTTHNILPFSDKTAMVPNDMDL